MDSQQQQQQQQQPTTTPTPTSTSTPRLDWLSDELVLRILGYSDVPDILSCSRTCRRFRVLSFDPILHAQRRHEALQRLSVSLSHRPSLSSLLPPQSTIYLSTTHVLARRLSRQLVAIRLNRSLSRRPSASSLVKSNILPPECCSCDRATGEMVWGGGVSPGIVEAKRRVERERVKDGLRAWLERKADTIITRQRGGSSNGGGAREERASVRNLVRRFTTGKKTERRHPSRRDDDENAPTRAHVYGLRRFWEGIAKGQQGVRVVEVY